MLATPSAEVRVGERGLETLVAVTAGSAGEAGDSGADTAVLAARETLDPKLPTR